MIVCHVQVKEHNSTEKTLEEEKVFCMNSGLTQVPNGGVGVRGGVSSSASPTKKKSVSKVIYS